MHKSPPNPSDKSRLIYTFHMIEGEGAVYDEKNWYATRSERFIRTGLIVSGYNQQSPCLSRRCFDHRNELVVRMHTFTTHRKSYSMGHNYNFIRTYGAPAVRPPSTTIVCPLMYDESSTQSAFFHMGPKDTKTYQKQGTVPPGLPLIWVSAVLGSPRWGGWGGGMTYRHPNLAS